MALAAKTSVHQPLQSEPILTSGLRRGMALASPARALLGALSGNLGPELGFLQTFLLTVPEGPRLAFGAIAWRPADAAAAPSASEGRSAPVRAWAPRCRLPLCTCMPARARRNATNPHTRHRNPVTPLLHKTTARKRCAVTDHPIVMRNAVV